MSKYSWTPHKWTSVESTVGSVVHASTLSALPSRLQNPQVDSSPTEWAFVISQDLWKACIDNPIWKKMNSITEVVLTGVIKDTPQ